jgi:hypothetical protein
VDAEVTEARKFVGYVYIAVWGIWWRSWFRHFVQAGGWRVRFPMVILLFFYLHNMALGSTQPITEMSKRNFSRGLKNGDLHSGRMWKE